MFFLIALLIFFLMHALVIFWFCQNTLGFALTTLTKFLPFALTLIYILLFMAARKFNLWHLEAALLIYLGTLFIAFSIVALLLILAFALKLLHLTLPINLGIPAFIALVLIALVSLYTAAKTPTVKTINLQAPNLTENKKIAFVADTHFGATVSKKRAEDLQKILIQENPDLILFGGDVFETNYQDSIPYSEILANILPGKKLGVFGNHEYYIGLTQARNSFNKAGINLLENTSRNFENINIIGINDIKTSQITKQEFDNILKKEIKPNAFNVLITHSPVYFEEAAKNGVDLMMSGHTHKGQIFPFNSLVRLTTPYVYGQFQEGKSNLIVTSGTFFWGPPMRFLTNNELIIINLIGQKK